MRLPCGTDNDNDREELRLALISSVEEALRESSSSGPFLGNELQHHFPILPRQTRGDSVPSFGYPWSSPHLPDRRFTTVHGPPTGFLLNQSLGLSRSVANDVLWAEALLRSLPCPLNGRFRSQAPSYFSIIQEHLTAEKTKIEANISALLALGNVSIPRPVTSLAFPGSSAKALLSPMLLPQLRSSASTGSAAAPDESPAASSEKVTLTLQAIGSSLRRRTDPYVDCASLSIPDEYRKINYGASSAPQPHGGGGGGGVAEPFPEKLFRMLTATEENGWTDIISFLPHGRAFFVQDPDRFVTEIMPHYFQQTKWSSFTRQLNLWGFLRVRTGPDVGAFYHELFLKGYPGLCTHMRRVGTSTSGLDRRKFKCKSTDGGDPDFYAMKRLGERD